MYNMNPSGLPGGLSGVLLGVPGSEGTGATPRTPEIVNSLIAMTDPFKLVRAGTGGGGGVTAGPRLANSPPCDATSASGSPPSLQHMKTQLIKEGLKLTIQSKRKNNGEVPPAVTIERARTRTVSEEVSQDSQDLSGDGLTPEDEERRRRRRERNKIAATKCRLKKRERTTNLVHESENLESLNYELKSQIQALENQKQSLFDLLRDHRPCMKGSFEGVSASTSNAPTPYESSNAPTPYDSPSAPSPYPRLPLDSPPAPSPYPRLPLEPANHYSYGSPSSTSTSLTFHHKMSSCEVSKFRDTAMYYRQETSYNCRTSGPSTSAASIYEESLVSDPGVMLPYCTKPADPPSYLRVDPLYAMSADSPHAYVSSQDSPTSSGYARPSSISVTTSSSDYESNTELLDSPNLPPPGYGHFDNAAGFPAGSCMS